MKAVKILVGSSIGIVLLISVTVDSLVNTKAGMVVAVGGVALAYLLQRIAYWIDSEMARKRRAAVETAAWKDLW